MRVCLISGSYPPIHCGIGDFALKLATAMAQQGAMIQIITSRHEVAASCGGGVTVLPLVDKWNLGALSLILAQLRTELPDLVNVQYPTQQYGRSLAINVLPTFLRVQLRLPVVTTIHEFGTYRQLGKLRVALSGLTSHRLVVTDQANLRQIESFVPFLKTKLELIPIGANIEPCMSNVQRQQQRAMYGATDADIVLAYFGFISPSKGLETLLPAFQTARRANSGLRLLLIADRDPADASYADYHRRIENLLDQLDLHEQVHWTGYVSPAQVSALLASADIAVLPFRDGASLRRTTLISALSHGLPTLSTIGVGATRDSLGEDTGVRLIPPSNVLVLAEAILTLASDPAGRLRLSEHARQFASRFRWDNIARQTLSVFERVLNANLL